ncbi:hypothetical protein GGS21DRAFT_346990 [Xylaria nigripes]|nr:hypothetical protein GGS21DRAFT_346990 [Xylaria nigripes]
MSPGLRPLQLPLLVERRRKQEEWTTTLSRVAVTAVPGGTAEDDGSFINRYPSWQHQEIHSYPLTSVDSTSSDMTSPVTPTFSAWQHLRYSDSLSSFDSATPASCEDLPSSPTQVQFPKKRILDDVEEEPFEYDRFDCYIRYDHVAYDNLSENFDLYDCLCDEPCTHRDTTFDLFSQEKDSKYHIECLSDSDFPGYPRASRRNRTGSVPVLKGLSHRLGSRLPSFSRWKSPRKLSTASSPNSDASSENRSMSRAASSRSSSVSGSNQPPPECSNEPPYPPTPELSFLESSDSVSLPGPLDTSQADSVLLSIQRERALATTPLLPPMMTSNSADYVAVKRSPLQSPTIACPLGEEPQSPLLLCPSLSTRPSISSIRQIMAPSELPPNPDSWSDLLGHANFTILPVPHKPEVAALTTLRKLREDWETARVNYTKHLVRTGEHYGLTSKTYNYTERKWAEIDRTWRRFHDEIVDAIVASGEAAGCGKIGECIITTVPRMDAEGKFPERGDEDIVGPMVREAMMSSPERKRLGFWRNLSDRVGLRR